MHLFWKGSAQVSPHRSDRTLIQNFAAPAPRQGARLDASKRGQILIKSVSNASGSRTCLISAQAKISVIPSAARTAMARRGRVEGLLLSPGIEGRVEIESQWTARKRESLGLLCSWSGGMNIPVSPTGDVILSQALFAERRTWARRANASRFLPAFGANASCRAPSQITLARKAGPAPSAPHPVMPVHQAVQVRGQVTPCCYQSTRFYAGSFLKSFSQCPTSCTVPDPGLVFGSHPTRFPLGSVMKQPHMNLPSLCKVRGGEPVFFGPVIFVILLPFLSRNGESPWNSNVMSPSLLK